MACRNVTQVNVPEGARAAYARGKWKEAFDAFIAADAASPLEPDDLDRLAAAAFLIGEDALSLQCRTRAHAAFLDHHDSLGAARSAIWIAFLMMDTPKQRAQAFGWLARAQRLLEDADAPCVEHGWVQCATARQRAGSGDMAGAQAAFAEAAAVGQRFGDRDLLTLARHGLGRTLVMMNQTDAGLALLDEAMVAVASGEIAPIVAGAVYCSVITACHDIFDVRRAQEWTDALQGWCESQPDLVPFRGYCLVRRSELLQLHGAWEHAMSEARRACDRLADPSSRPEAGAAFYQLADLHRLRGEFAKADEAYRSASQAGRKPQPGLALLRLNQGQLDAADTSIRLALQEVRDTHGRVVVLSAAVEIMLAKADVAAARAASDELSQFAQTLGLPYPNALSCSARGAVALAEGEPLRALESLHAACAGWQELDAPYPHAQTRMMIGLAYRQLGDLEGAELEFDAAHEAFERLGAAPAATRVAALTRRSPIAPATGLTGREVEVLRLVATGITNHAIATRLHISERTVDRHVSNIFTKLDLSSRAAATAYAYQHKLL